LALSKKIQPKQQVAFKMVDLSNDCCEKKWFKG